ncbi:unnamed protein product [Mycena citricolor]|uniref:Repressor of RNA polymerase III transcription MAF1 n=1 Tax=Mycena citricolor TaxID=2018698 RepID=A0AAD2H3Z5_9AGAR|nr:unnamed protein product [Mycena citricolor]CAK5269212.1 unnamed protein product [Mycena citricolor]
MKFIDVPALSRLAQALGHDGPECSVHTRIEAYSCKNIKRDKKLFKSLEHAYKDEIAHSPSWLPPDSQEMTPFGPLADESARKTMYLLISTLNIAFPDYDFSDVRPNQFVKEKSGASVLNALSTTLALPHRGGSSNAPRTFSSYPPSYPDIFPSSEPTSSSPLSSLLRSPLAPPPVVSGTHPTLYRLLDDVIGVADCEVYSYVPDLASDPHADVDGDEDDGTSDESDSTDDGELFEFDNYDIDEALSRSPPSPSTSPPSPDAAWPPSSRRKHGALLWSSHWFFLNRKLKRILFMSIWARSQILGRGWIDDSVDYLDLQAKTTERFHGWEGGAGAGARALGLDVF